MGDHTIRIGAHRFREPAENSVRLLLVAGHVDAPAFGAQHADAERVELDHMWVLEPLGIVAALRVERDGLLLRGRRTRLRERRADGERRRGQHDQTYAPLAHVSFTSGWDVKNTRR